MLKEKTEVGKKLTLTAMIGKEDNFLDKICLVAVTLGGDPYSDHEWVIHDRNRMRNLKYGDFIRFTAYVSEYKGLDEDKNLVTKKGLCDIRNIQRL
jgi:hypothetical protein